MPYGYLASVDTARPLPGLDGMPDAPAGSHAAIVEVYRQGAYEVEIFDDRGNTIGLTSATDADLAPPTPRNRHGMHACNHKEGDTVRLTRRIRDAHAGAIARVETVSDDGYWLHAVDEHTDESLDLIYASDIDLEPGPNRPVRSGLGPLKERDTRHGESSSPG